MTGCRRGAASRRVGVTGCLNDWYADYALSQGLAGQLRQPPTVTELSQFLKRGYEGFKTSHSQEPWADYTAHQLIATYGERR